jgi:hypothetical protein
VESRQPLAVIDSNLQSAACARLQGFIRLVNSSGGNKLTPAQAAQLLETATSIRTALGF